MTREGARKAAEVMLAYADGKEIECKIAMDEWDVIEDPNFYWHDKTYDYRIKPEPKYRPFKDANECWQEMQKHQPFGWLKGKNSKNPILMGLLEGDDKVWFAGIEQACDYAFVQEYYTFADGAPFGIEEE